MFKCTLCIMHEKSALFIKLLKYQKLEIGKRHLRIFLYLLCVYISTSSLYNMYSPAVLSPGLEVNFATSTIFTAKICPVWRWMHFRTTLNGPLQQCGRDVNNNNYTRGMIVKYELCIHCLITRKSDKKLTPININY